MNYTEIEILVNYSRIARARHERVSKSNNPPEKDLTTEIYDYKAEPAVKEMQRNFQENLNFPDSVRQIENDYRQFIDLIKENIQQYSQKDQEVFGWKVDLLERQLRLKTISAKVIAEGPELIQAKIHNSEEFSNPEESLESYKKTGQIKVLLPRRLLYYQFSNNNELKKFIEESKKNYILFFHKVKPEEWDDLSNDFFDYFLKLAEKQTSTKYRHRLVGFVEEIKSYYNYQVSQLEYIKNLKGAINPSLLEIAKQYRDEEGNFNPFYYKKIIKEWEKQRLDFLFKQESLLSRKSIIVVFVRTIGHLIESTFEAFDTIQKYSNENKLIINKFNLKKLDVENTLDRILEDADVIKLNVISEEYNIAIKLQEVFMLLFEEAINTLAKIGVNISRSSLNSIFEEVRVQLKEVIDTQRIAILQTKEEREIVQPEVVSNTTNLHSHIFKNNAFDVWRSMFEAFNITEKDRSDVKFMFEEMKKDGLIHNTVTQKHYLDWISKTYEITVGKTNNYSRTSTRMSIYSTAKQLYKN